MQQIVVNVLEESDVQAIVDETLASWKSGVTGTITDWSDNIVEQINQINAYIADIVAINVKQGKRINALAARISAVEEAIASPDIPGTYEDTY